jgi:hypothetical protein
VICGKLLFALHHLFRFCEGASMQSLLKIGGLNLISSMILSLHLDPIYAGCYRPSNTPPRKNGEAFHLPT